MDDNPYQPPQVSSDNPEPMPVVVQHSNQVRYIGLFFFYVFLVVPMAVAILAYLRR